MPIDLDQDENILAKAEYFWHTHLFPKIVYVHGIELCLFVSWVTLPGNRDRICTSTYWVVLGRITQSTLGAGPARCMKVLKNIWPASYPPHFQLHLNANVIFHIFVFFFAFVSYLLVQLSFKSVQHRDRPLYLSSISILTKFEVQFCERYSCSWQKKGQKWS